MRAVTGRPLEGVPSSKQKSEGHSEETSGDIYWDTMAIIIAITKFSIVIMYLELLYVMHSSKFFASLP